MISSDALRFPFLGTRQGEEPFEYLLMDINYEKAEIAVFKWMVIHTTLQVGERVDLFLPVTLTTQYDFRHNVSGVIAAMKEDPLTQEYLHEVVFDQDLLKLFPNDHSLEQFSQKLPLDTDPSDLLLRLIKDSILLKQGLLVYLKHLSPYFSRIVNYPIEDYKAFKALIFDDVVHRIQNNEVTLNKLYLFLKENVKNIQDISLHLNMEEFREILESEINLDLFLIAFTAQATGRDLVNLLKHPEVNTTTYREYHYINYLLAIKNLEKRLYSNYNQIVLIYMKSISSQAAN